MTYSLTQWTIEDYHKMIDAGILNERRVELIEGEIIEMSPEGAFHRFVNLTGANYLRSLLGEKAIISEVHPITLSDSGSEPEPDIAIVRPPIINYKTRHPYPQDIYWLIEIADSTLQKDLTLKKAVYARVNIPEYWVIDLQNQILYVFQNPQENDYQVTKTYREGEIYSLAFPHIKIQVNLLLGVE